MPTVDRVALDAEAVRVGVELVRHATVGDLAKPTPCRAWTLYGLLAHLATQHYGFAAASRGDADPAVWKLRDLGDDPVTAYAESAGHVLAAFAEPGVTARRFPLPEFGEGLTFPGDQAIGFHLIDYVVHAWDVARTLGLRPTFSTALLDAAASIAGSVPDGEARRTPGAPFAAAVPWLGDDALDRIVSRLGRNPVWPD